MNVSGGLPRLIVAGVASGVGKTTIATGLMMALTAQGLRVQGYKVGPDYIDPTYHRAATGRPSYNLDTWLSSPPMVRRRFEIAMREADIALVEGVMGLFDGRKRTRDEASTAEIARLLNAPVLLVIDVSHMGQSVAALASGFRDLDPRISIAGVILNKVASTDHEATLRYAITEWTGIPILGAIYRDAALTIPARHLGLVPQAEAAIEVQRVGAAIKHFVDVPEIVRIARSAGPLPEAALEAGRSGSVAVPRLETSQPVSPVRMGLAMDTAFSFYYPETLETFADMGIEVIPFSPLKDTEPPAEAEVLYFGGGFPEVFAAQLAANQAMLAGIRSAIRGGVLVYAECGGYMYLGKSCIDATHTEHQLLGILPYTFDMGAERAQLGYREVTLMRDTIIGPAGTRLRGHEFHWSRIRESLVEGHAAYQLEERRGAPEGFASSTILASYIHVPLAANPSCMKRLVQVCLSRRTMPGTTEALFLQ